MDRAVAKVCSLPCFNKNFHKVLILLQLVTVELILAFDAHSGVQFAELVLDLAPALISGLLDSELQDALELIAGSCDDLAMLWILVSAAKDTLLKDSARLAGFGTASLQSSGSARAKVDHGLKRPRMSSSAALSSAAPRLNGSREPSSSITPLMEKELLLKSKWIRRLERICEMAGSAAGFNQAAPIDDALSTEERVKLKRLVLAVGAFRTLGTHVRHWERFAAWCSLQGLSAYPPSSSAVLKYLLSLSARECGPTVIPSVRAAIAWLGKRIQLDVPPMDSPEIRALELQVIELRAKETKEAAPLPIDLVLALERLFHIEALARPVAAIFLGWILCLIYASLRFNDGVHVKPSSLEFRDNVLYGLCWQTKVERKRRGTRFAIASVGLIPSGELDADGSVQKPWLEVFWSLFQQHACSDRDFWMFEIDTWEVFSPTEVTYHRGLKCFKGLCAAATKKFIPDERKPALAAIITGLTWHSCRVTMLSAAVHAGVDALPISMQANHANTDLIVKYTRDRRTVPLKMVGQLLQDLRSKWIPSATAGSANIDEDQFSADEDDDQAPVYYIKRSKVTSRSILTQKFHITAKDDLSELACSRVQIGECDPIGHDVPDVSVLCTICRKNRPDLWPPV